VENQTQQQLTTPIDAKQEGWLPPTEHASVPAHFSLHWVRPWDNRGKFLHGWKEDSMLIKRIAAYTHLFSTVYM